MRRLEVTLHLVRPRELLLTNRAGKHLPLGTLVIEECMPLKTVLVLEVLGDLNSLALDAAVRAVRGDGRVPQQVEPADRHLGKGLGPSPVVLVPPEVRGPVSPPRAAVVVTPSRRGRSVGSGGGGRCSGSRARGGRRGR